MSFEENENEVDVEINIIDDNVRENNEIFDVQLSAWDLTDPMSNGEIHATDYRHNVTILNDDGEK